MSAFRPYAEASLQYYLRGVCDAYAASAVSPPGGDVPEDMAEPYGDGIADGTRWASDGFPVEPACFDLSMGHSPLSAPAEAVDLGVEGYGFARSLSHLRTAGEAAETAEAALAAMEAAFGAVVFEGAVLFLMISIAATTHYRFPEEVLRPDTYQGAMDFLAGLEEPLSLELFIGGGVDEDVVGCQLRMTRVHKTAEAVLAELSAMGRPRYVICSLRTDMSAGLRIVARSE